MMIMSETKEKKFVMPGDEIALLEEYLPGAGAYEENGIVYSEYAGFLTLDPIEKVASVRPVKETGALHRGDIIYGIVKSIRSMMAVVDAIEIEGRTREIAGSTNGTLHISKMSTRYVSDAERVFRIEDVIRAEVISATPSLQISTARPDLGVVLALCRRCRKPMIKKGKVLYCEDCEISENRPVSTRYGQYVLTRPDTANNKGERK